MISKRDSKPFMIKNAIGVSKTSSKTKMIYDDDWQTLYGLISDPSGQLSRNLYGNETQFDKVIVVNAGSISRTIAYNTLFMLDDMPTSNYPLGEYAVKYIYPEYNGEITIGLTKVESIDKPKLYFYHNNNILYYQLNYDASTKTAYISSKTNLPFETGDYVWTKEPTSNSSTNNRLIFSGQSQIGFDEHYLNFYELTFTEE